MTEQMTPKERWLAAIRMKPVDRLPFWPKLDGAYPPAQQSPFREMDVDSIHDWIGSDKHIWINGCTRDTRSRTSVEEIKDNNTMRTVFRTPHGEMTQVNTFDAPSNSWHPVEFPVKDVESIKWMTEMYDDITVKLDPDALLKARSQAEEIGQNAVTANAVGESALMHWVEWDAGVENGHCLLMDYPDEAEALFDAMHRFLLRKTTLISDNSPADLIYMIENTSTTLISPSQYQRYCLPHLREYARIAGNAGRNMVLHMCGHLKALLPDLATLPVQAFEAFTSPTLGNTSLLDGRSACPDKCLVGGTNAVQWTKTAQEIISKIEHDLDELPHHRGIVVTSAGVMTPLCKPETIRHVCEWVKHYSIRH